MAGYAAAMDASMSEGSSTQDVTAAIASGTSSPPEESEPQEGPSGIGRPPEDWESQTGEELDHASLSMCVSEASCKKSRGERSQRGLTEATSPCGHDIAGLIGVLFHKSYFKSSKNILALKAEFDHFLHLAVFMAICCS